MPAKSGKGTVPARKTQESTPAAIRLQFVLASGLASRLIAWYGQGYGGFSHVDAVLPSGELMGCRSDVIGGVPAGLQIRQPDYERWIRRTVVTIACSQSIADQWEGWLRAHAGAKYDKPAIWGFILGKPDHAEGHWICSAAQRGALTAVQLLHDCDVPDSQTTPDTLYQLTTAGLGGAAKHYAVTP